MTDYLKSTHDTMDLGIQLTTIEDLRKQRLYNKAYALALTIYEKHRDNLKPLQINSLFSELIANGRMLSLKYEEEFLSVLKASQNMEQLRDSCHINCHAIRYTSMNFQEHINEMVKTVELENVKKYSMNGRT